MGGFAGTAAAGTAGDQMSQNDMYDNWLGIEDTKPPGMEFFDPYQDMGIRELFKQLTSQVATDSRGPITPYGGQVTPGASELQQQGFGMAGGLTPMARGGQDFFMQALARADPTQAQQMQGMAGAGIQKQLEPYDPAGAKEYWQKGFVDPAMQNWQQDIMPAIKESYASRNAADSGAMDRALARSGSDLSTNLNAELARLLYSGQQSWEGRQQPAIDQAMSLAGLGGDIVGQAGQIGGIGSDFMSQLMNMGGIQRDITGEQGQEAYQKWAMQQPYNNPWYGIGSTLAYGAPQGSGYMQEQGPGMAAQMMPTLGAAAGSYFANRPQQEPQTSYTPGGYGGYGGGGGGYGGGYGGGMTTQEQWDSGQYPWQTY